MNHSELDELELWCRLLDGQPLSSTEYDQLRSALAANEELRQSCSIDATTHAMLNSLDEISQSKEMFIAGVLEKCPKHVLGSATGQSSVSDKRIRPKVTADAIANRRRRRSLVIYMQSMALAVTVFFAVGFLLTWVFSIRTQDAKTVQNKPQRESRSQIVGNEAPKTPYVNSDHVPETAQPTVDLDAVAKNETDTRFYEGDASKILANPPNQPQTLNTSSERFVTITKLSNLVCERQLGIGDRLGDEIIRLFGGTIELTFDDGAVLNVEGPVEFQPIAVAHLRLRRGKLSAYVPQEAIGFVVSTPTSKVIDLGTEFDVFVKETGATEVEIKKGEVEVAPISMAQAEPESVRPWRLEPKKLNRATFLAQVDTTRESPIAATAQGKNGQFVGFISMNGRAVEFSTEASFQNVHQNVMKSFARHQEQMIHQWTSFADQWKNSRFTGSFNVNGVEIPFSNLSEVMSVQQSMQNQILKQNGNPLQPNMPFSGAIIINGKSQQFRSLEEYDAARREAFGSAAAFGAGLLPGADR